MAAANPNTLFMSDLDKLITEPQIQKLFKDKGLNPAVCKIFKNAIPGKPHNGIITFADHEEATRALNILNFSEINDSKIRLQWYNPDPQQRKSGEGNVYVKNLDKTIDNKDLYNQFSIYGNILSCKVEYDNKGKSRGYGFIQYETQEEADRSIKALNETEWNGKVISVCQHQKRNEREIIEKFNNIHVKGLPVDDFTEENLKDLFQKCGDITSVFLEAKPREENKEARYGFVCFKDPEDAKAAVETFDGHDLNGKTLQVCRALNRDQLSKKIEDDKVEMKKKAQDSNLIIKPLPSHVHLFCHKKKKITDEDLEKLFSKYGTVLSAKVSTDDSKDKDGNLKSVSRGFGFVNFSTHDEAMNAFLKLDRVYRWGNILQISFWEPRQERIQGRVNPDEAAETALKAMMM